MKKIMKRALSMMMVFIMLLCMGTTVLAENDILVLLNGNVLVFKDQNPVIVNDRTLVPFRGILEAMGATVNWEGTTRTVTAEKDGITVTLTIDDPVIYKNGEAITLDVPAQIINDRTMVPARAVSESFGAKVEWDGTWRYVVISTDPLINKAVEIANSAKEFYWFADTSFTYLGYPVTVGMSIGTDNENKKTLFGLYMDMGILGTEDSTVIGGEDKIYTEENGVVTVEDVAEGWEQLPAFDEATPFLRESESNGKVTYQIIDGSRMKLVVDKETAQPLKLMYPKEVLGELFDLEGGIYKEDMSGDIVLNGGKLMEIWNQYEQQQ